MNNLSRLYQRYQVEIEEKIVSAARSGWWLNGINVKRFADNFAAYIGVAECALVANGTDALELALRATLQEKGARGNEVVLAANAGGYATCASRLMGLVPHYVDIDRASQLVSIPAVLAAVRDGTSAIVVTHLYGGVVDVPLLRQGLTNMNLAHVAIIEDCAQAHGARLNNAKAGSFGDAATFSFYPTKNLGALGDAGAVVTSELAIADRVRRLQQYGWSSKYYVQTSNGRNSRMDELQAAALDALLPQLDARNGERRAILRRYRSVTGQRVKFVDGGSGGVAHLAVLLCKERDILREFLRSRGIESDIHYPVLDCDQPAWVEAPMQGQKELSVSRTSVGSLCSIPCYPELTAEEVERVCAALTEWENR